MSITAQQLAADITEINTLLSDIGALFPNPTTNTVIAFLEAADQNALVQDVMLLVLNGLAPAPTPAPTPAPAAHKA